MSRMKQASSVTFIINSVPISLRSSPSCLNNNTRLVCAISRSYFTTPLRSLFPSYYQNPKKKCKTIAQFSNHNHRTKSRSRKRQPRHVSNTAEMKINSVIQTARSAWKTASPLSRLIVTTIVIAGLSVTAAAVNIALHISFILAFALVPLMLAPLLLTVAAGLGVFALLATATAGAGFMFVGTPLVMVAVAAKALLPVFIFAAVASSVFNSVGRALGFRKENEMAMEEEEDDELDEDDYDMGMNYADELSEFDRMLRNRTGGGPLYNVDEWGMNEVVNELDACGLGRYRQLFIDERIDGSTLVSLSDEDIRTEFSESMPLGDRRRLSRLVSSLRRRSSS